MNPASTDELVEIVENLMGASYDKVSDEGKVLACDLAQTELEWSLPQTDSFRLYWIVQRARRHLVYILLCETAHKFRFKEIHLHNRFKQYHQLVELMDDEFQKAIDARPLDFDHLASNTTDGAFGLYVTSGFNYNYAGEDLTYRNWE